MVQRATLKKRNLPIRKVRSKLRGSQEANAARTIIAPSGKVISFDVVLSAFDTFESLYAKRLPKETFAALMASTAYGKNYVKPNPIPVLKQWKLLISSHQPTAETFDISSTFSGKQRQTCGLHVCLDVLTKKRGTDALEVCDYMIAHYCPPYARGTAIIFEDTTFYLNPASAENNAAIYGDRSSKFRAKSCCAHVEHRMQSSLAVRNAGMGNISAIQSLNHVQFWKNNLRLIEPRTTDFWVYTDALIKRFPNILDKWKSHGHTNARARLYQLIKRGCCVQSMTGSGEDVLPAVEAWAWERDVLRKKKPVLIDNSSFLPSHVGCYRTKKPRT